MTARPVHRGFTLVELLVVMYFLGVAMSFGTIMLLATFRIERFSAETIQRVTRLSQLADTFRDDVANATEAPETHGAFTRGPHCLILRQPNDVWVVYQWTDGMLLRRQDESRRVIVTGPGDVIIAFDRVGRLIQMHLTERERNRTRQTWEVAAALGGDRQ